VILLLLLTISELCAFQFYRKQRRAAASSWLALSALVTFIAMGLEFYTDLVPATYEVYKVRQATFDAHRRLAAAEVLTLMLAVLWSFLPSRSGRFCFWLGWTLNLAIIGVDAFVAFF
jgi:hypothetical protein